MVAKSSALSKTMEMISRAKGANGEMKMEGCCKEIDVIFKIAWAGISASEDDPYWFEG